MKKILFILEGADKEQIREFHKKFNEEDSPIAMTNDRIKIFQLEDNGIKRVYPEILKEKLKLGYLEISNERPEGVIINKKILKEARKPRFKDLKKAMVPKRKRSTKAEMEAKKPEELHKTRSKYPEEMLTLVKENMPIKSNQEICDIINERWDLSMTKDRLKNFFQAHKLKREKRIREKSAQKKIGKPKKYNDEVVQFLRENINNFSNKELCEELESRFNVKTKSYLMSQILSDRGIKRDINSDIDKEVIDYISKSKINDVYYLRDQIIEKFEKDIPTKKLRELMSQRKTLPGENVEEEVKRIKQHREEFEEDDIDEMELDK